MCNEALIKDDEFKKTLNIMNRSWGNPIHNGLNLKRIHVNAISRNNILEKFHFNLIEFAFPQLNVESNFFELDQNKSNMSFMFLFVLGKNEDVINVTNHKVFTKNIIHQMLKDDMGIGEAKRYHHIFKMAIMGSKNNIPSITFPNMHQIICTT
jgi:hypothetical protein